MRLLTDLDCSNGTVTVATPTNNNHAATKGYVDGVLSGVTTGLKTPVGIDCSTNPNYPSATAGDHYLVTLAGKIGGNNGIAVEVGDAIIASADNAGGDQGTVGSDWFVIQGNIPRPYSELIGDGSASAFTITHNLNTSLIDVSTWEQTTGEKVLVGEKYINDNAISIDFGSYVPTQNEFKVVVQSR